MLDMIAKDALDAEPGERLRHYETTGVLGQGC